jgi:hypothetical protein
MKLFLNNKAGSGYIIHERFGNAFLSGFFVSGSGLYI